MSYPPAAPPNEPKPKTTGRRAGESGTREAIIDVALAMFADNGYEATSVRAIAQKAGVDPALIRHFFTSKEGLFSAAMIDRNKIPNKIAEALSSPIESRGLALTTAYLNLWENETTKPILSGLFRSAMTSGLGIDYILNLAEGQIHQTNQRNLATALGQNKTALTNAGSALALAHLLGVAISRNVLNLPALVDMPFADLVEQVAPTIQKYLESN